MNGTDGSASCLRNRSDELSLAQFRENNNRVIKILCLHSV